MDRRPSEASKVCTSNGSMICLAAGLDISAYCTPIRRRIKGPGTESGSVTFKYYQKADCQTPATFVYITLRDGAPIA